MAGWNVLEPALDPTLDPVSAKWPTSQVVPSDHLQPRLPNKAVASFHLHNQVAHSWGTKDSTLIMYVCISIYIYYIYMVIIIYLYICVHGAQAYIKIKLKDRIAPQVNFFQ